MNHKWKIIFLSVVFRTLNVTKFCSTSQERMIYFLSCSKPFQKHSMKMLKIYLKGSILAYLILNQFDGNKNETNYRSYDPQLEIYPNN